MSNRAYVHLKSSLLGDASVTALADTFKVLGDTTRVRILDVLSQTELCVQDLAGVLGLTQSAVSHQLRLLRSSRLVRTRRDGRQIFYALDDDHIVGLFQQGLEHVEERVGIARPLRPRALHDRAAATRTSRRPPRISSPI
jgi:ArsR family transcriptional regulator, lead/cadmium/zinc/bismuth-responsive transcriptional repressor